MNRGTINSNTLDFSIALYYAVVIFQDFFSRKISLLYDFVDGGDYDKFTPYHVCFYAFIMLAPLIFFVYLLTSMGQLKSYQYIAILLGPLLAVCVFNY